MSKIRKFMYRLSKIYVWAPIKLSYKINEKLTTEFLTAVCDTVQSSNGNYTNVICRPKHSEQVHKIDFYKKEKNLAIVLQGPIETKDNFTIETVKVYKKIFPNDKIIISTWENTDTKIVDEFTSLGCEVVLNKKPDASGKGNVNFQLVSSLNGAIKAKNLNCDYVIKTRTDQRISYQYVTAYLKNLIDIFPDNSNKQKRRIVILQGSTGCMFLPYYIADFFYFGHVDDIIKLFSCPLQKENFKNKKETNEYDLEISKKYPIGEALHICSPQNYIMENYARSIGYIPDGSVYQYWNFIKDCVVPISVNQLGLIWRKYNNHIYENLWNQDYLFNDSEEKLLSYNWTFENWLNLYRGNIEYSEELEKIKNRMRFE